MWDSRERQIDYMRVSITDRCNLRCRYCMPEGIALKEMEEILTYEEIEMVCRAAAKVGIRKFKITGGEPLVRKGCPQLIGRLKQIPGIEQVTLTTNGVLLTEMMRALREDGLDAVNISLDTLDRKKYQEITGRDELRRVLEGIDRAVSEGIPVKVNAVLQRGINDKEWESILELARERRLDVRFIEMMPIGFGNRDESISNEILKKQISEKYGALEEDYSVHGNGPAVYYHIKGFQGSVGFISAIHNKFCAGCNRIRLTSVGEIKPCLCYKDTVSLKEILRGQTAGKKEERLIEAIKTAIRMKPEAHCFEKQEEITEDGKMVQIGG